jgi:hypothetical protein
MMALCIGFAVDPYLAMPKDSLRLARLSFFSPFAMRRPAD